MNGTECVGRYEAARSEAPLAGAKIAAASLRFRSPRRHMRGRPAGRECTRPVTLLLRLVDTNVPAIELVAIELLRGLARRRAVGKFDERESARPTAVAVGRHEHADNLTHLAEEALEFTLCRVEAEVSDEQFWVNGALLSLAS